MSDKLLDRFTKRPADGRDARPEPEEAEDLGCFGWLRGVRDRAVMLELRRKDGHSLAVGYGWIERVEFKPDEGITLHLPGRAVRIRGSGLNTEAPGSVRLFDGIIRHRVPWVREADRPAAIAAVPGEALVERIEWED